ncbi:NifB/NifX family molybdenum-iron cluster-binding protein [Clostridium ganghwense]|uniref:NifB/NifX family molybdenum-iron cluster-binding protein n=1 Tax=Clostridium ganghwense TaxID=312089 RepID=A0ABT4CRT0_9CLOT|nr:NifB/NifX family molybdenum-iron cluster-binding protein [Clostridium ganghwense]MCY6371775.1 NifB/NifX family molybdenum-iron cluster-binding protein [Clostridium ganghwense]
MKILVSAYGKEKNDLLDSRFGRCSYFQIFDTETNEHTAVENKGVTSSQGAGITAAQQVVDNEVEVVITGSAGPNAFRILNSSDIRIFKAAEEKVEDVINAYMQGKLEEISGAGAAHKGMAR